VFFERPQSGERAVLVHLELGGGGAQEDPRELEELVLSAGGGSAIARIPGISSAPASLPRSRRPSGRTTRRW